MQRFQLALVLLREGLFDQIEPRGKNVRVAFDGSFGFPTGLFDGLLQDVLLLLKTGRDQRLGIHVRFVRGNGSGGIRGMNPQRPQKSQRQANRPVPNRITFRTRDAMN